MSPKFIFLFYLTALLSLKVHAQTVWTLKDVVDYALLHNPSIQLLDDKRTSFDMQLDAQQSQFTPKGTVSMHADLDHNQEGQFRRHAKRAGVTPSLSWRLPTGTLVQGQVTQFVEKQDRLLNNTQWKLSLEQPLLKGFDWQNNQYAVFDAQQSRALAKINHEQIKAKILYSVLTQYAHLANAWAQADSQKAHFAKHQHFKDIVKKKIELGLMSEVDGMMLDLQTAKYHQMLEQSNWQIEQLSAKLAQTMGGEWYEPIRVETHAIQVSQSMTMDSVLDAAVDYHTQSYAIELERAKRQERLIRDETKWDISVKAFLSKGRQQYQTTPDFDFDPYDHIHANSQKYVGLYVTIPLNQNKQAMSQLYQNKLSQKILMSEQQSKMYATKLQINQAQKHLEHGLAHLEIAQKSYDISVKAKDILQEKYLAGYASSLDLQQAQTQALQAQTDVHAARMQVFLAHTELLFQSGLIAEQWSRYV